MDNSYIIDIIKTYLRAYRVSFKWDELRLVLLSDPTFPSMASISRTFAYYGIQTDAYTIDYKVSASITKCIVHSNRPKGHFFILKKITGNTVILYDGKTISIPTNRFYAIWDGIVLIVNKPPKETACEGGKSWCSIFYNIVAILVAITIIGLFCPLLPAASAILDMLGILICLELKRENVGVVENRFCKIGKKFDCHYVSSHAPLRNIIPVDLEELGLFYFLWDILSAVVIQQLTLIEFIASIVSFAFCFVLLIYQIVALKRFCLYCLSLYAIVLVKTFLCLFYFGHITLLPNILLVSVLMALISFEISVAVNSYVYLCKKVFNTNVKILKIKRNSMIYRLLTAKSPNFSLAYTGGLKFGVNKAPCHIEMLVSLKCKYCRKAINDVSKMIERFPDRFYVRITVLGNSDSISENNHEEFLKSNYRELLILEKYNTSDRNISIMKGGVCHKTKPSKISNCTINKYKEILNSIKKENVNSLPFIAINGKVKPQEYEITDYQYIYSGECI